MTASQTSGAGEHLMPITVEAVYENGVLRPVQPLPLAEHQRVNVTVTPQASWVERTAGICGFKGSVEEADYFARSPDLDFPPAEGEE